MKRGIGHVLVEGHRKEVCPDCAGIEAAALQAADEALAAALAVADELMTEFVSKRRAADWGVINDGLLQVGRARKMIDNWRNRGEVSHE